MYIEENRQSNNSIQRRERKTKMGTKYRYIKIQQRESETGRNGNKGKNEKFG